MTDAETRELHRVLNAVLAEPDTPLGAEWRRAANLLASSRPDATARLLRRLVAGTIAQAPVTAPASPDAPPATSVGVIEADGRPALAPSQDGRPAPASTTRQVATLAVGVGAGVVGGGLVLAGLDALLGDEGDLL
ncbi:MAG: hypothetical protein MUC74_06850 [Ideonella sp.]|jgi:hypothetical protein|nr:hypothetical protein [Ideonella sp.]